jgi:hypothetical protein
MKSNNSAVPKKCKSKPIATMVVDIFLADDPVTKAKTHKLGKLKIASPRRKKRL